VLARLVDPEQYGLVGMALALIGVGDSLLNLGLSQATVQRRDITRAQVTFFFWLQLAVGAALSLLCVVIARPVADFYGHEELVALTAVLGTAFVLNGASAQHQAVLARQMRFGALARIDVVGLALGVAAAIVAAALGAGVWALVLLSLATPVCRVVLSWTASGWRPGPPRRTAGVAGMVRFGLNLTLTNALDYSAQNLDNVLIGRFFGAQPLGLYSRAYGLLLLPLRQVTAPLARVAVPVLSYLQHEPDRFRRFFVTALSAVAYVTVPLICLTSALSREVVGVMLGPRWAGAAPIFQILAIGGVLVCLRATNGWLFVSTGHTGRQAMWALANRPVVIAGFLVGLPWGVRGVAWGFVGAHLLLVLPSFVVAVKDTPVSLGDVGRAVVRPMCVAAEVYAVGLAVHLTVQAPDFVVLACGGALSALAVGVTMLCWAALRRDLSALKQAFALARQPSAAAGTPATAVTSEVLS
jgi:PST family polysaccharide transporter